MSTVFDVNIYSTAITVYPGKEATQLLRPLLNLFEYEDEYLEQSLILGYILDDDTDILYLNRGVDIEYLRRLLVSARIVHQEPVESKPMKFDYEEIISPRNDDQKDVINFIAGLNQHSSNQSEHQLFLVKDPGFGKQEPYSRKIPTPTEKGYTLMGDLKVGDKVFDRHGKPTTVIGIYEQGVSDVYKVTFQDGRVAYCGKEHLWAVRGKKDKKFKVVSLENIIDNYQSTDKTDGHKDYYIPTCGPVLYSSHEVAIHPWVMGYIMHNIYYGNTILTIPTLTEKIPKLIGEICGFNVMKNNYIGLYSFYHENGESVYKNKFFKEFPEIWEMGSWNKMIPEVYIINDIKTRFLLLKGLMNAGGYVAYIDGKKCVCEYFSTSVKLLKQMQQILYSLGFSSKITNVINDSSGILTFTIPNSFKEELFSIPTEDKYMIDDNKLYQILYNRNTRRYNDILIENIEYSHKEECRCIMVDNPEHLYLTEDFIVTHNTYCSGVGLCLYGQKTLIIVHRDNLRSQWMNSLRDMSGLTSRYVHEIVSSEEFEYICDNPDLDYEYDVYIMTHATFRAGLKRVGSFERAANFSKNLHLGFKIIDEAHLEFRDTLLMDFIFNINRNLYLTATDGRSSKEENAIFKHVFSNTKFYRKPTINPNQPSKWVNYNTITIDTHLNPNVYRYRVAGGRGMSPASYGKWCIKGDKNKTHIKVCCDIVRQTFEKNENSKVIIFMPLIELCEETADFIYQKLSHDDSFPYDIKIRTINSRNSKAENERNKQSDVIVSTTGSLSTGVDIKGVTTIISCSPMVSKIQCVQTWGRIRYGGYGFIGDYYDIIDQSCLLDTIWQKSRYKVFKNLALNINHYYWTLDDSDNEESVT